MSEGDEAVALTTEEIDARLAGIDLPEGEPQYKFFKPTADAVDRWVEYAKGSHDCFHLGLQGHRQSHARSLAERRTRRHRQSTQRQIRSASILNGTQPTRRPRLLRSHIHS